MPAGPSFGTGRGPNTHINLGLLAYSVGDEETALSEFMGGAALNPDFCA